MELKQIIAKNLIELRTKAGMTQLQLAEKLNYSYKAVSKWERAEAIPDLRVLIQISQLYHITLDELVSEHTEKPIKPKMNLAQRRILICLLSTGLCFFVSAVVFMVLYLVPICRPYAWTAFLGAPLAASIVYTVFSCLWFRKLVCCISCSCIVWSMILAVHVLFAFIFVNLLDKVFIFYIAAGVFQVLIILWFYFRKIIRRGK